VAPPTVGHTGGQQERSGCSRPNGASSLAGGVLPIPASGPRSTKEGRQLGFGDDAFSNAYRQCGETTSASDQRARRVCRGIGRGNAENALNHLLRECGEGGPSAGPATRRAGSTDDRVPLEHGGGGCCAADQDLILCARSGSRPPREGGWAVPTRDVRPMWAG